MRIESERIPWRESAERLLERIPGIVSATIEGTQHSVFRVRVWYEPTWPVSQVLEAVRRCLIEDAKARIVATRFQAIVAQPDRRGERRPRFEGAPAPTPYRALSPDASIDRKSTRLNSSH